MGGMPPREMESDNQEATSDATLNDQVVTPRRYRVFTLRDFILKMYNIEYLKSGTILDIAGGKGDLSWLLTNADGLDSIVIDPRVTDHIKLTRTCEWLIEHPIQAEEFTSGEQFQPLTLLSIQKPFIPARHVRMFMDQECVDAVLSQSINNDVMTSSSNSITDKWELFFKRASERAESTEGDLAHHQPKKQKGDHDDESDSPRITSSLKAIEIFQKVKLFVGFHPDEATEAIVDLAIKKQIPFIIVPCCVFPKHFPNRRLGGKSVSTYKDFITYLTNKHPAIRRAILPFYAKSGNGESGARSTVLFTLPKDYDLKCTEVSVL